MPLGGTPPLVDPLGERAALEGAVPLGDTFGDPLKLPLGVPLFIPLGEAPLGIPLEPPRLPRKGDGSVP